VTTARTAGEINTATPPLSQPTVSVRPAPLGARCRVVDAGGPRLGDGVTKVWRVADAEARQPPPGCKGGGRHMRARAATMRVHADAMAARARGCRRCYEPASPSPAHSLNRVCQLCRREGDCRHVVRCLPQRLLGR
jgi:hypothetical protein